MKETIWVQEGPMIASEKKMFMIGNYVKCKDSDDTWIVLVVNKKGLLILGKQCSIFEKGKIRYIDNLYMVDIK